LFASGAAPAVAQWNAPCPRLSNAVIDDACAKVPYPVPASLWQGSEIQPVDPAPLPGRSGEKRYTSDFNEFGGAESVVPWFMSLDIENGYVFIAGGYRLQIGDNGLNPANADGTVNMKLLGEVKGQGSLGFPFLYQGE